MTSWLLLNERWHSAVTRFQEHCWLSHYSQKRLPGAALRVELWEFSLISISLSSKEQPQFADCSKVRNRRPSERELCQYRWWAGSGHAVHQNSKRGSAIPAVARQVPLHPWMRSLLPASQQGHASGDRCVGSSFAPGGS